jgi:hypothetical protein
MIKRFTRYGFALGLGKFLLLALFGPSYSVSAKNIGGN